MKRCQGGKSPREWGQGLILGVLSPQTPAKCCYGLKAWDLASGEVLHTLEGHTGGVTEVKVTADGTRAVSVSRDSTLVSWGLESGTRVAAFAGDAPMTAVVLARDGRTIAAGDNQGRVHFLRIDQALKSPVHPGSIRRRPLRGSISTSRTLTTRHERT